MKVSFAEDPVQEEQVFYYEYYTEEESDDDEELDDVEHTVEYITQMPTRRAHLIAVAIYSFAYLIAISSVLTFGSRFGSVKVVHEEATLCCKELLSVPSAFAAASPRHSQELGAFQGHETETVTDHPVFYPRAFYFVHRLGENHEIRLNSSVQHTLPPTVASRSDNIFAKETVHDEDDIYNSVLCGSSSLD